MEKIIEKKTCKHCSANFHITDRDIEFYNKISPVFAWKKYNIPTPKLCPDCRQQRRLSFRNERYIYKRKCDATGQDIVSIYSPDTSYKIYELNYWKSDKFDAMDYGREYNFSKSFFDQYKELLIDVPKNSINSSSSNENSQYVNYCSYMKNSYLIFDSMKTEDSYYGVKVTGCKDSIDNTHIYFSENCYECNDCSKCYWLSFSSFCEWSSQSMFLSSCIGCENCFMCFWLVNKKYHFKNKEYSKEKYEKIISEYIEKINSWKIEEIKEEFYNFILSKAHKNLNLIWSENCTWNNITNSSNSSHCFDVVNIENSKYCSAIFNSQDCYDYESWWDKSFMIYDCIAVWSKSNNVLFSSWALSWASNSLYCAYSSRCKNVFGCIWIRDKEYCILNKQYTKEEYENLVPKIIEKMIQDGEWWEFFPSNMSSFWYNETVANEYFPLTKQEALEKWFNWSGYEAPFPKVEKIIPASKLPSDIKEIPDDILNWAIECEVTKKPFRIIKPELEFYRKHNLWVPKRHPDQRHLDRMSLRNPRKLYERKCDKCNVEIQTTYAPERKETVYCEECYHKEIY